MGGPECIAKRTQRIRAWGGPGITAYFSCIRRITLFVCRLGDSTTVQSAFALPADLGHRGVEGCTLFVGALDDRRPLFSKGSHYDVHLLSSGTDSGNACPVTLAPRLGNEETRAVCTLGTVCLGCVTCVRVVPDWPNFFLEQRETLAKLLWLCNCSSVMLTGRSASIGVSNGGPARRVHSTYALHRSRSSRRAKIQ
jgi:hypothetical protein